jgi:hypothetical protein
LAGSGEGVPKEIADILLCQAMRWTWHDLMTTPEWVVERARLVIETQEAWREQESKKSGAR